MVRPSGRHPVDPHDTHRGPWLLVVRPRRIAMICGACAAVVIAVSIVTGILLHGTNDGVAFRPADQIGLIGIGLVLGGAIMTGARPRLRIDQRGLLVRNVLGETVFDWPEVLRIGFPEGSHWAQVVLADDEIHPLMAIQVMDKDRAVDSLKAVRALHARYGPPPSVPTPESIERARQDREAAIEAAAERPLGRLELIDLENAAKAEQPKPRRFHRGRPDAPSE